MCIQNALQQHILDITNDGKDIAEFFYATMHGRSPNAKFHHQMEAAKHLSKLGLPITPSPLTGEGWDGGENSTRPEPVKGHAQQDNPSPLTGEGRACPEHSRRDGSEDDIHAPSPLTGEGRDGGEDRENANPPHPVHPVTDLDIINYKVARLIREETNDGYFIAEFLTRVMHGTAGQGRPISEANRLRAATELMNRGLGRFGDTRDRRISSSQDDNDLVHSGLARYIREHTDHGLEPVRFLLDVASGQDGGFSMHQRVTATRELIRRGWDTNYDRITPDDIAAYYERQDAREPTSYDNRLQEWREKERAAQEAQDKQLEEGPQMEAGLFAHLSEAEVARYEAMSAEEQADFIEQQRQRRATRQSAAAHQITPSPSTEVHHDGSKDDIDTPSPSTGEGWDGGESSARPEHSRRDGGENPENINWNTLLQDDALSTNTPLPSHPVKSETQTQIRSP